MINEIKKLILEKYPSESEFARQLGWSRQKLSLITTFRREPDLSDIKTISTGLGIDDYLIYQIFLSKWSPNR